jgi:hypothetical protein
MEVKGGAANYRLDFTGDLRRDGRVRVATAMSAVELYVPATTAAKVKCESLFGEPEIEAGFTQRDGAFWTAAAAHDGMPLLNVQSSVTMGKVTLRCTQPEAEVPVMPPWWST